jgi:hypothetical protein
MLKQVYNHWSEISMFVEVKGVDVCHCLSVTTVSL